MTIGSLSRLTRALDRAARAGAISCDPRMAARASRSATATGVGWKPLKRDGTDRRGYWRTTTRYRRHRSYAIRWTATDGRRYSGPRTR